ncbi:hypothetical protein M2227_002527 [Bradyrhizobium elkanii]|uniref:hypothetical protein n=1 Tax=Bradyrhizobium elkanii TaxID=29448 RepID=UPI002226A224|nr:hypothetical protein [Bradyrhizobium elkanii]MCW2200437.1 hypothetical protein [Bradyrhizobium elkanii]
MGVMETEQQQAPVFLTRELRYVVGVDLGQSSDPTAIAVIEHRKGVIDSGSAQDRHCGLTAHLQKPAEYADVRYLQRLPLGMAYPAVVQHVADLLARPPINNATLIIDETGVGRAVGDIFVDAGLKPKRVSITAGNEESGHGVDRWHVAKSILISRLDAMLHTGMLRFAADLTEAGAMAEELKDFRRKVSDAGRATYAARTGRHDDLVLAVAIAGWWVTRPHRCASMDYYKRTH